MLSFEPATTDQHYEALLQLIYNQKSAYLDPVLDLIDLTQEQFGRYFRSTGTAYRIYLDKKLAGLCWIIERECTLVLLGLIVKTEFQGRGIGSQALTWLESHCSAECQVCELDVYCTNIRARALYERMGYQVIQHDTQTGFYTMRKALQKTVLQV
jgi:ribosomal protein S18 acetylase RimI-like enzyme